MARLVRAMGKTKPGLWLWQLGRSNRLAGVVIGAGTSTLRGLEWAVLRRMPAHRRHDAAARATLAAFEAETRARRSDPET